MTKPTLFIFGELAPISTVAAGYTIQTALFMNEHADVTVVIADHAPVPLPVPKTIKVKRHRDLINLNKREQTAARLFILGDSYQSLDTLKLYERFSGTVIVATKSLYRLFVAHLKTTPDWPFNYTNWLRQCFGDKADIIAQALLRRGRESDAIADEIPLELIFPSIYQHQLQLPELTSGLPVCPHSSDTQQKNLARDVPTILVIGPHEGAEEAVKNLTDLGKDIAFTNIHGSDAHITQYISRSDIILISESKRDVPAYLPLVLQGKKPLITAGQKWAQHVVAPSFNMPHAQADQRLTAALGAIISKPEIHDWLAAYNCHLEGLLHDLDFSRCHTQILQETDRALIIDDQKEIASPQVSTESPAEIEATGQVALVGAVPPKAILEDAFPEFDSATSPKFATDTLCTTLQLYSDTPLPILLSQLGYEASIISDSSVGGHCTVSEITSQLKHAKKAVSFGSSMEGTISANKHLSSYLSNHKSNIPVSFPASIKEDTLSGYEPVSGLLWKRDPVRDIVSCVFILGLPGSYKLCLNAGGNLTVSSATATHRLNQKTPLRLETDTTGVLFFTVAVEDPAKNQESCSEILTKSLADYPLNLEWLDHD
ncbi:hypothetical protein KFE96_06960 [Kordiimonas sp. SCSIO 12603]|uniref:hypothetical protein n=1 Tax=Kordiimonas sp. SCSIO 12603 TaxID=2829596 RepID=UPI002104945E|nr:hypothetical protein [Kordiimonas sp. SCSIO 12603]UTW60042.1 hypothetical protein KFE96_06960 [Kordiimonas sp. SCSIO 12603]